MTNKAFCTIPFKILIVFFLKKPGLLANHSNERGVVYPFCERMLQDHVVDLVWF